MDRMGMNDDLPLEHGMITGSIETAQRRVEAQHFDSRKNLLEYDDVMNQQRKSIYDLRRFVLGADQAALRDHSLDAIEDLVVNLVDQYCHEKERPDNWRIDEMITAFKNQFGVEVNLDQLPRARNRYMEHMYFQAEAPFKVKVEEVEETQPELMSRLEKQFFLQQIDQQWKDHLTTMDQLRTGIGLRGYGQRDPKKEYQRKAFDSFGVWYMK